MAATRTKLLRQEVELNYPSLLSKRRFERDCKEADRAQQYFEKMDADINVTKADVEKVRKRNGVMEKMVMVSLSGHNDSVIDVGIARTQLLVVTVFVYLHTCVVLTAEPPAGRCLIYFKEAEPRRGAVQCRKWLTVPVAIGGDQSASAQRGLPEWDAGANEALPEKWELSIRICQIRISQSSKERGANQVWSAVEKPLKPGDPCWDLGAGSPGLKGRVGLLLVRPLVEDSNEIATKL
ncbi:UNVERIFIED_CONTAM: hypothetical protein K2H54_052687 [Gekko kuhli]